MHGFREENGALVREAGHEILRLEAWGKDALRVRATRAERVLDLDWALLPPAQAKAEVEIGGESASIRNGAIAAEVSPRGIVRFTRTATGEELLAESQIENVFVQGSRTFRPLGGDRWRVEVNFKAYEGERVYGLGQQQHGRLDQKGCAVELVQRNTTVSIPFLVSSRRYGFLWNNPAVGRVEPAVNFTRWIAEAARQIDYVVVTGGSYADIMERYAELTGRAPLLPEWAAGFWQSKLRYMSRDELMAVARGYRERGLPLSVIVIDFFHWTVMGEWRFDERSWPDPASMVRELEGMGVRVMVSVWPTVNPVSENHDAMLKRGLLVRTEAGDAARRTMHDNRPEGPVDMRFYDPTNPEAREFIWERCREGYHRHGIKVWWLDACEPALLPEQPENLRYHAGNGLEVANLYPLDHARAFYDGMRSEGEEEIVLLSRAGWAGSQRYAAAIWSGDIGTTFEVLRAQVRGGLNIAMSGIPWWTTDIGGFLGGDPGSPEYSEVMVRWFEYGTFCPLFRLHGNRRSPEGKGCAPNEVWSYGDEAYGIMKKYMFLRERLKPYVMAQMRLAHEKGTPPMRPVFFDFAADERSYDVEDEFMFGPDLLVAPVLHEGARSREVYLPAGASWRDAWTGDRREGGAAFTAEAPLDTIPLYLRGDVELPIRG
jgi:alpha-D-xyloside xylohydrolase